MKTIVIYRDFHKEYHYALGEDEKLRIIFCDISDDNFMTSLHISLANNTQCEVIGLLLKSGDCKSSFNYYVEHHGKQSVSDFHLTSLLDDEAKKKTNMRISFAKGATNAVGAEHEQCTLLTDAAHNISLPCIDTHEEKIRGTHGISSGHIPQEQIQYLKSRGFSLAEIRKMIVRSAVKRIFEEIEDEDALEYLQERLSEYEKHSR